MFGCMRYLCFTYVCMRIPGFITFSSKRRYYFPHKSNFVNWPLETFEFSLKFQTKEVFSTLSYYIFYLLVRLF